MKKKDRGISRQGLRKFWIIGGGRFGRIAVERIRQCVKEAEIILVDSEPVPLTFENLSVVQGDGIEWVHRMLKRKMEVDLIVPALPVHLVVEWLKLQLKGKNELQPVPFKEMWLEMLPHPFKGKEGQVYVSHADFLCPDSCREPKNYCTHTGKPRPRSLFRLLEEVSIEGVEPVVVRSHQLLPGVGGIYPFDLLGVGEKISQCTNQTFMIGTACRCHGVVDFLRCVKSDI